MGNLTLVEKDTDCRDAIEWPLFYMNDFSVMGLLVERLGWALDVLEAEGYQVMRNACSAKVRFKDHHHFKKIFRTLERNNIAHSMSDLVGCAYQG